MCNKSDCNVTVIIPNYNNKKLLSNLLDSLKKIKTSFDIIIVDNSSQDDSVSFLKNNYPEIKLIENKENKGFAYAVNQGIKESKTKYVFLLNNDTVVQENILDELLKTMHKDNSIFSVSAKMIQLNNTQLIDDAGDNYNILGWSKKRGNNHNISEYSEDSEIFGACAGAALYKRDIFDVIGLFDENFESYVEDMDISFRARIYGYKSYYSANSIVYHYGSASTGSKYNPFKIKISARNNIYLIHKNMPNWMKLINFIFILFGVLVKYLFFRRKGYGNDYLDGIKEGIKTKNNLKKVTHGTTQNYLKIEWFMIKNTFNYLFE